MANRGRPSSVPHWMTEDASTAPRSSNVTAAPSRTLAPAPVVTDDPEARAWEEHRAPDGRPYWYNVNTKSSTYQKPECLMTTLERAERATRWTAYNTPSDEAGRTRRYYVHDVTGETTWEVPKEIQEVREIVRRKTGSGRGTARASGATELDAKARVTTHYASVEDAKEAFKKMLAAHGVRANTKWEEVVNRTKTDERFDALATTSEKKQCLNEYQMMQTKLEREAKRMAEKKAREGFVALLEERREALNITSSTRLTRDDGIEAALCEDVRWKAVSNSRERVELFEDFTRGLQHREARERKQSKLETQQEFRECLVEAGIDVETPWRKAYEAVKNDERAARCQPMDQLEVFEALMRDLMKAEENAVDDARRAQSREERKRREAFVELLRERQSDGVIQPRMPWKSFVARVENDARYLDMCQNLDGSRPRELFEDLINDIEDENDRLLDDFEDLLHDGYKARELFGDTTWEAAEKLYRLDAAWKHAPRKEAREMFDKFIKKVARREREKAAKRKGEYSDDSRGKRRHSGRDNDDDDDR